MRPRSPAPRRRRGLAAAGLAFALLPALLVLPARATTDARPAVIGHRVIGHSVQGRPIVAWHLGEPGKKKVVLISLMHGNEPAPRRILNDLRDGAPVHDVNLWVVPVYTRTAWRTTPARTPTASTRTGTTPSSGPASPAATTRGRSPGPSRRPGR